MTHALQCECGTLKGFVADPRNTFRALCYCRDCQAFAHFLGRERDVLDERGGTGVIQTVPRSVTITQGLGALACMRLTPKGLLRWYATCCKTPVGSTLANPRLSFVGLVDVCLRDPNRSLEDAFGKVRALVHVESARGAPRPRPMGQGRMIGFALATLLKARLNGDYRRTPFFSPLRGQPIAVPRILSDAQHATLMKSVLAASA